MRRLDLLTLLVLTCARPAGAQAWTPPDMPLPGTLSPRPLPDGVTRGARPGEYVNEADGTLLVWVPAGRVVRPGDREPTTFTRGFFLAARPVSREQVAAFHAATGRPPPPEGEPALSFEEATAYAAWAGLRLPTVAERDLALAHEGGAAFVGLRRGGEWAEALRPRPAPPEGEPSLGDQLRALQARFDPPGAGAPVDPGGAQARGLRLARSFRERVEGLPAVDGSVPQVDPSGWIRLSVGSDDRVRPGSYFTIYRGSRVIGRVVVEEVARDSASAWVLFTAEGATVQPGDNAATRLWDGPEDPGAELGARDLHRPETPQERARREEALARYRAVMAELARPGAPDRDQRLREAVKELEDAVSPPRR